MVRGRVRGPSPRPPGAGDVSAGEEVGDDLLGGTLPDADGSASSLIRVDGSRAMHTSTSRGWRGKASPGG
jgi:hypothetical protein